MDCPSSLGLLKFQDWYKNCYSNLQVTAIKKGVGWGENKYPQIFIQGGQPNGLQPASVY